MNYQEALRNLKSKKDKKFVLIGDELFLKDSFISVAKNVYSDSEFSVYYPDSEKEALSDIYSGGFFGARLIILRDLEKMNLNKICSALENSIDAIIMIPTKKVNVKTKGMTNIISSAVSVSCKKMNVFGNSYPLWIRKQISSHGYDLEEGAEDILYSLTGPSMYTIYLEIKKLLIYKKENKSISNQDVRGIVSNMNVSNGFDFFEKLIRKNTKKAIQSFESYMSSNDNFTEFIGFLSHYFEKLYRILLLKDQGMSPDDIASIIGLPKFIVKMKYLPRATALGKSKIPNGIDQVYHLDHDIRSFRGDKKLLFYRFIRKFCE